MSVQLSNTPNSQNETQNDWELSKENFQPLKAGRKCGGLKDNTTELRKQLVEEQRRHAETLSSYRFISVLSSKKASTRMRSFLCRAFWEEISAYSGDDPLEAWLRYTMLKLPGLATTGTEHTNNVRLQVYQVDTRYFSGRRSQSGASAAFRKMYTRIATPSKVPERYQISQGVGAICKLLRFCHLAKLHMRPVKMNPDNSLLMICRLTACLTLETYSAFSR